MTPKEKLQKRIVDKAAELQAAEQRAEMLARELNLLENMMGDLFGKSARPGSVPEREQEQFLEVLDHAPAAGLTVKTIAEAIYGAANVTEAAKGRITQKLVRGMEKGTMERVSKGHYRIKRSATVSVLPNS